MFTRQVITISLGLALILSTLAGAREMSRGDYKLQSSLTETLNKFATAEKLDNRKLNDLLFDKCNQNMCMSKGGIGVIDRNLYIQLRSEKNSISVSNQEWHGQPYKCVETVITDGQRILSNDQNVSINSICVILFTPDQVAFIDYRNKTTGVYRRIAPQPEPVR